MFRPSKITCPVTEAVGTRSFMRLKLRNSVLLPQPEGPIMAVILMLGHVHADFADRRLAAVEDARSPSSLDDCVGARLLFQPVARHANLPVGFENLLRRKTASPFIASRSTTSSTMMPAAAASWNLRLGTRESS